MPVWIKASIAGLLLGLAGGAGYLWWQQRPPAQTAPIASTPPPEAAASAPAAASEPAIRHPIEAADAGTQAGLPALAQSDRVVADALIALVGRKDVQGFLQIDGFVRRVVATVDNLGRQQAAARLWPVAPTPGRFGVAERSEGSTLADANAERYAPFVRFATSIDTAQAAALYVRLYPLFQAAYEELGYPGRHFNDRLVDVIDLLLQTPEPTGPPRLTLTAVQGPIAPARPWLRYEFADPTLESRPAGQKILMRVGAQNEKQLKAKLREFRARIAKP